jgi:hypothetical protein
MTSEQWNYLYGVGTSVNYHPVIGLPDHEKMITYSDAWTLESGEAVIQLVGKAGCVALDAISVDLAIERYAELGQKIMEHAGNCKCDDCQEFLKQGDIVHEMGLQA